MRMARLVAIVAVFVVLGGVVTVAVARSGGLTTSSGGNAEVRGAFEMRGVITNALNVNGEKPGEHVRRRWVIHPVECVGSVCSVLRVVRNRGAGRQQYVLLHRVAAGEYLGNGAFWVALECLGRTYRLGSRAPYTITLRVTRRQLIGNVWYATSVRATYENYARTDGTPCPLGPSSDAARYDGTISSRLPVVPVTKTVTTPTPTTTTPTTTTPTTTTSTTTTPTTTTTG